MRISITSSMASGAFEVRHPVYLPKGRKPWERLPDHGNRIAVDVVVGGDHLHAADECGCDKYAVEGVVVVLRWLLRWWMASSLSRVFDVVQAERLANQYLGDHRGQVCRVGI